jgi:hypothetical protein
LVWFRLPPPGLPLAELVDRSAPRRTEGVDLTRRTTKENEEDGGDED